MTISFCLSFSIFSLFIYLSFFLGSVAKTEKEKARWNLSKTYPSKWVFICYRCSLKKTTNYLQALCKLTVMLNCFRKLASFLHLFMNCLVVIVICEYTGQPDKVMVLVILSTDVNGLFEIPTKVRVYCTSYSYLASEKRLNVFTLLQLTQAKNKTLFKREKQNQENLCQRLDALLTSVVKQGSIN